MAQRHGPDPQLGQSKGGKSRDRRLSFVWCFTPDSLYDLWKDARMLGTSLPKSAGVLKIPRSIKYSTAVES